MLFIHQTAANHLGFLAYCLEKNFDTKTVLLQEYCPEKDFDTKTIHLQVHCLEKDRHQTAAC